MVKWIIKPLKKTNLVRTWLTLVLLNRKSTFSFFITKSIGCVTRISIFPHSGKLKSGDLGFEYDANSTVISISSTSSYLALTTRNLSSRREGLAYTWSAPSEECPQEDRRCGGRTSSPGGCRSLPGDGTRPAPTRKGAAGVAVAAGAGCTPADLISARRPCWRTGLSWWWRRGSRRWSASRSPRSVWCRGVPEVEFSSGAGDL